MTEQPALQAQPDRKSLLQRITDYIDWRANPVLVKDLRLWMRGKLFIIMFFLLVMLVVIGSGLYTFMAREWDSNGKVLWGVLFGAMLAVCGAVVPNMIYERFRAELKNRATELAMLSELTAARIVRGKLLSAWCGSLLVISAAAPAFSTAYLLGGIDFHMAFYFIAWMIWVVIVMPTIQLMLATLGAHVGFRLFAIVAFLAQFIGAISMASGFYVSFICDNNLNDKEVWIVSGFLYFGGLALAYFFYHVAISRLRGDNEDREFAPRFILSLTALIAALALGIVLLHTAFMHKGHVLLASANVVSWIVGIGFLFITRTTDHLPVRLTLNWPRMGIGRLLFYPGNRRLCAFALANYLVVFILVLLSALVENSAINRDWYQIASIALLPYLVIGAGLVAHDILVVPFCNRRGWRSSAIISIVGTNIGLGFASAILFVLTYVDQSLRGISNYLLCISPAGFLFQMARSADLGSLQAATLILIIESILITVFLLVIVASAWAEGMRHHISGAGKYTISTAEEHAE